MKYRKNSNSLTLGLLLFCGTLTAAPSGEGRFLSLQKNLQEACALAGGELSSSWDCHCPNAGNGNAQLFDAERLQCQENKIFNSSCKDVSDQAMRACLVNFARSSAVRVNLNADSESYPYIRRFLEHDAARLPLRLPAELEGTPGATLTLSVGNRFRPSAEMMEKLQRNELVASAYERDPGTAFLYIPTIEELPIALGASPANTSIFDKANDSDELISDVSRLLQAWSSHASGIQALAYETHSPQRSCLKYCKIMSTIDVPGFSNLAPNVLVRKIERLQRGLRLPREITLAYADTGIDFAKIIMDFADRPSIILTQQIRRVDQRVFNESKVYDRFLNRLGTFENQIVGNMDDLQNLLLSSRDRPLAPQEIPIASFEADIDFFDTDALLIGPRFNALNLSGWYPNNGRLSPFAYRGVVANSYDGLFPLFSSPGHAKTVTQLLRGSFDIQSNSGFAPVRILPLGQQITATAMSSALSLARQHTNNRLRIGSLQHRILLDSSSCQPALNSVFQTGLLLVTAAGNEGRNLEENELCPAILGGHSNLVVVGAGNADGLARYSNFSPLLVDIAASGDSPQSPGEGTSFAAPKVAYALAQLGHENPLASNSELRAAVLLSTEIPSIPLPVRGAGLLNRNLDVMRRALQTLTSRDVSDRKAIKSLVPFDIAVPVIRSVENDDKYLLSDRSLQRLEALINSGLICQPLQSNRACRLGDWDCSDLQNKSSRSCG